MYKAKRCGVKSDPPTLVLDYEVVATGKMHRRQMPIRNITLETDPSAVARKFKNSSRHGKYLDKVRITRLERILEQCITAVQQKLVEKENRESRSEEEKHDKKSDDIGDEVVPLKDGFDNFDPIGVQSQSDINKIKQSDNKEDMHAVNLSGSLNKDSSDSKSKKGERRAGTVDADDTLRSFYLPEEENNEYVIKKHSTKRLADRNNKDFVSSPESAKAKVILENVKELSSSVSDRSSTKDGNNHVRDFGDPASHESGVPKSKVKNIDDFKESYYEIAQVPRKNVLDFKKGVDIDGLFDFDDNAKSGNGKGGSDFRLSNHGEAVGTIQSSNFMAEISTMVQFDRASFDQRRFEVMASEMKDDLYDFDGSAPYDNNESMVRMDSKSVPEADKGASASRGLQENSSSATTFSNSSGLQEKKKSYSEHLKSSSHSKVRRKSNEDIVGYDYDNLYHEDEQREPQIKEKSISECIEEVLNDFDNDASLGVNEESKDYLARPISEDGNFDHEDADIIIAASKKDSERRVLKSDDDYELNFEPVNDKDVVKEDLSGFDKTDISTEVRKTNDIELNSSDKEKFNTWDAKDFETKNTYEERKSHPNVYEGEGPGYSKLIKSNVSVKGSRDFKDDDVSLRSLDQTDMEKPLSNSSLKNVLRNNSSLKKFTDSNAAVKISREFDDDPYMRKPYQADIEKQLSKPGSKNFYGDLDEDSSTKFLESNTAGKVSHDFDADESYLRRQEHADTDKMISKSSLKNFYEDETSSAKFLGNNAANVSQDFGLDGAYHSKPDQADIQQKSSKPSFHNFYGDIDEDSSTKFLESSAAAKVSQDLDEHRLKFRELDQSGIGKPSSKPSLKNLQGGDSFSTKLKESIATAKDSQDFDDDVYLRKLEEADIDKQSSKPSFKSHLRNIFGDEDSSSKIVELPKHSQNFAEYVDVAKETSVEFRKQSSKPDFQELYGNSSSTKFVQSSISGNNSHLIGVNEHDLLDLEPNQANFEQNYYEKPTSDIVFGETSFQSSSSRHTSLLDHQVSAKKHFSQEELDKISSNKHIPDPGLYDFDAFVTSPSSESGLGRTSFVVDNSRDDPYNFDGYSAREANKEGQVRNIGDRHSSTGGRDLGVISELSDDLSFDDDLGSPSGAPRKPTRLVLDDDFGAVGEKDLNKLGDSDLMFEKSKMNKDFIEKVVKPGDRGYVYNKEVDFAKMYAGENISDNDWDDE